MSYRRQYIFVGIGRLSIAKNPATTAIETDVSLAGLISRRIHDSSADSGHTQRQRSTECNNLRDINEQKPLIFDKAINARRACLGAYADIWRSDILWGGCLFWPLQPVALRPTAIADEQYRFAY